MIIAIGMVKDEEDIILHSLLNLWTQGVDKIVVADNMSTDATPTILEAAKSILPLEVEDDNEVAYYQSIKITDLASRHAHEGDWVIPFDADELWTPWHRHKNIADVLRSTSADVIHGTIFHYFKTSKDEILLSWRKQEYAPLPKVAFKWRQGTVIEQGNHNVNIGGNRPHSLVVRHYPYRSFLQFKRKVINGAKAYKETDLPHDTGKHWRDYGQVYDTHGTDGLFRIWNEFFYFEQPYEQGLIYDPYEIAL